MTHQAVIERICGQAGANPERHRVRRHKRCPKQVSILSNVAEIGSDLLLPQDCWKIQRPHASPVRRRLVPSNNSDQVPRVARCDSISSCIASISASQAPDSKSSLERSTFSSLRASSLRPLDRSQRGCEGTTVSFEHRVAWSSHAPSLGTSRDLEGL